MTWRREAPAVSAPPPGPPRKQGRTAWLLAARGLRPTALWQRPAGVIPLGKKEEVGGSLRLIAWAPAHIATGLAAFGTERRPCYSWAGRNVLTSVLAGGTEGQSRTPILKPLGLGLDCSLFPLCSIPSSFLQNAGGCSGAATLHAPGKGRGVEMGCGKESNHWDMALLSPLCLSISSCQS